MATIPVPRTWVNGEFETDTIMNGSTGIRDAMNFLLSPPVCQVRRTTGQSIPSATPTPIAFDAEDEDNDGIHSLVTNTSRLTIVTPGWYNVSGMVPYSANGTGGRECRIVKNGVVNGVLGGRVLGPIPSGSIDTCVPIHAIEVQCVAGDFLELYAVQTTGGALTTTATNSIFPILRAAWVRP
jgi:hypothetical protein